MNKKMDLKDGMINFCRDYTKITHIVTERIIKSRGSATPAYRPYIKQEGIGFDGICKNLVVDLKRFYTGGNTGDISYASCNINAEKDADMLVNITGIVKVFFNGECVFSSLSDSITALEDDVYVNIPISVKKGADNHLIIKSVCRGDDFGFKLNISVSKCPGLWASFYLMWAREQLPIKGLEREQGIALSPLYSTDLSVEDAYETELSYEMVFPKFEKEDNEFDFNKIYGCGNTAYAYSRAAKDGFISIQPHSYVKILINGEAKDSVTHVAFNQGDEILIKSVCENGQWGFSVTENSGLSLSFLGTDRNSDFVFLVCGPFYSGMKTIKLPPEYSTTLHKPYPDGKGGRVFWRFKTDYLRIYVDSSFFGQWYYATMLSFYGVRKSARTLDNREYYDYYEKNSSFLANMYEYAKYDGQKFVSAPFMASVASMYYLDHIGTMGVNMIESYIDTGDLEYIPIIHELGRHIKNSVPRFSDGTFCRQNNNTMWADDLFMSCPFLARLAYYMGYDECYEEIIRQIRGFKKRLYMDDENIFSHIYFIKEGESNKIPWGRGNGWIAFALSEILLHMEKDNKFYAEIVSIFSEFAQGLLSVQDEKGRWHQVLTNPESYAESSSTAMFALAFLRGIKNGWLDDSFTEPLRKAVDALLTEFIDKDGVMYGVCMGSSCSMDEKYYLTLPTIADDNHGTGVIMILFSELSEGDIL